MNAPCTACAGIVWPRTRGRAPRRRRERRRAEAEVDRGPDGLVDAHARHHRADDQVVDPAFAQLLLERRVEKPVRDDTSRRPASRYDAAVHGRRCGWTSWQTHWLRRSTPGTKGVRHRT